MAFFLLMAALWRLMKNDLAIFSAEGSCSRLFWGLNGLWDRMKSWLHYCTDWSSVVKAESPEKVWVPKNPEVEILPSYSRPPPAEFWSSFPKRLCPANSPIDTEVLSNRLSVCKDKLTPAQYNRGKRAIDNVNFGGSAFQGVDLPSVVVKNASNSEKFGKVITDNTATWVKSNFVCGPFDEPPFKKFRVNCLSPIEQNDKVRIVVNASLPESSSFNSNVQEHKIEKVRMTSARIFGHGLLKAGKGAVFSKFDQKDAYKNIPCRAEDLRLQGFKWLGKFFYESAQMFGARTAVANYDILGNTLLSICMAEHESKTIQAFRQLDDVPIIGVKGSSDCESFSASYKSLCEDANIRLAEDCPLRDKAFSNETEGKVLGIVFNSETLCWKFPEDKKMKVLLAIKKGLFEELSLKEVQSLVGQLSDLGQMSPFLAIFKKPLLEDLARATSLGESEKITLSVQSKKDLGVWAAMLLDKDPWHGIPWPNCGAPRYHKSVYSDAAGLPDGERNENGVGVAWVAFSEEGEYIGAQRLTWPDSFIESATDGKGARFGSKTTTLELFGILLPVLVLNRQFRDQHVVFHVDNIACAYGWESGYLKEDRCGSILLRSLKMVEMFLGSVFHVKFVPRVSTWEADQTDRMSRLSSMVDKDRALLRSFVMWEIPDVVVDWLEEPSEDWDFANKILDWVSKE